MQHSRWDTLIGAALAFGLALMMGQAARGAPEPAKATAAATQPDLSALARIAGFPRDAEVYANRPGFCIDVGCGDGKLDTEIAQKTTYSVFAIARSDANCAAARRTLDQAGLYGTRAMAVASSLEKIPLPNGYGNLIVTSDYQDSLNLKEVFRILNPNGVAIIGGGSADAAKLKAALDAAGVTDYKISGNFAIFHGQMPAGTDEWTHFTPRADNVTVSRETEVRPPFRTQWLLTEPSYDDKAVQHAAVAGGRVILYADAPHPLPNHYYAFDSFNGALLWDHPTAAGKGHNNYRFALVDNVFYASEGNTIVALDAASGRRMHVFPSPVEHAYWYWVAVQDGRLYALGHTNELPAADKGTEGLSDLFCAYDLKSGDLIWKLQCPIPAVMQSVALDTSGGLFYIAVDKKTEKDKEAPGAAICLDAASGHERWHQDLGEVTTQYNDCTAAGIYDGKYFVWCCENANHVTGTKALDAKTGQLFRDYPGVHSWGEGWVDQLLFVGDKIYCNTTAGHEPYQCYDIATGQRVEDPNQASARDHPGTATVNCIFAGGEGFCVYDLITGKTWSDPFVRFSDFGVPYLAEGMFFHMPTVCHCPHAFGGPEALAPAGLNWAPPDVNENIAKRLIAGPAIDAPLTENSSDDWVEYRGNSGHTGETVAPPNLPLQIGWVDKLGGSLTPPSCGAGLVFTASRTGSVWGIDQATGRIRWRFLAGAGVRVTPTFARGRVLFGSDDGWVYCLDAKTGQLAWRFQAAPEERYINMEGKMASQWPSVAGVVTDDKTAYCAAGLQSYDGTYLYALDIQTGKPIWAKRIGDLNHLGAPQGIMALTGDTLIVPVFSLEGSRAYRKTDGQEIPWYVKKRRFWTFGSEAIADGDVFFYGGARLDNDERTSRPAAFSLMDAKTGWLVGPTDDMKPVQIAPICVAPVLGKQEIVGSGAGYDRAKLIQTLEKGSNDIKAAETWTAALWPDAKEKTTALALAGNVMLAAGDLATANSDVVAFEAKPDGKELSRVNVPGEVLRNSLAISDGRVFIVTTSGNVCYLNGQ